jgi:hypothetical protein
VELTSCRARPLWGLLSLVVSVGVWAADPRPNITRYLDSLPDVKSQAAATEVIQPGPSTTEGLGDDRHACTVDGMRQQGTLQQLAAYGPNNGLLWPGALVQGRSLAGNQLAPVGLTHGPQEITVLSFIPTGTESIGALIQTPALRAVNDEIIDIVFGSSNPHQPAQMSFTKYEIFSAEQAVTTINATFSGPGVDFSSYLSTLDYSSRSHLILTFVQNYFEVTVAPPAHPSEFYGTRVSLREIKAQSSQTTGANPVVYVDSVTYGRAAYIVLSSTVSLRKLSAAVNASFGGLLASGHLGGTTEQQQVVRSSDQKVFVLGGDAAAGARLVTQNIAGLPEWISAGGTFSRESPGKPIAYSVRYLRSDYRPAGAFFTTDYSRPNCVPTPERIISVNRSYAIADDKDQGNSHRFLVYRGAELLNAETASGDDITWRTSPPNYNGPPLPINVPLSTCSQLKFRTEQTGSHGEMSGYAWVTGVTDAGRRISLVDREWFSLDDNAYRDYQANCRVGTPLKADDFPELRTNRKKDLKRPTKH